MEGEVRVFNTNYTIAAPERTIADELMISNILKTLENPNIKSLYTKEELMVILETVKNHALSSAFNAYQNQMNKTSIVASIPTNNNISR